MPRNTGLIVFLLFLVWQVVTAIINAINARKQQERAKQQLETTPVTTSSGPAKNRTSRIDELVAKRKAETQLQRQRRHEEAAARRKEQLDELRRRRQNRSSTPTTQTRIGTPGTATPRPTGDVPVGPPVGPPVRPPARTQPTITRSPSPAPAPPDPLQAARQEAILRQREAARQQARRAEQQRQAEQRKQQQQRITRQRAEASRRQQEALQAQGIQLSESQPIGPAVRISSIQKKLTDPRELREAIVLMELLDKPISLRPAPMW